MKQNKALLKQKMKQRNPSNDSTQLIKWLKQFEQESLFTKLLELYSFAAAFVVDKNHNILFCNSHAETLLGLKVQRIIGSRCDQFYDINENESCSGKQLKLHKTDGTWIEVKQYSQVLTDKEGTFLGALSLFIPEIVQKLEQDQQMPIPSKEYMNFHGMLSRSPAMQPVFQIIQNAAKTEATVLVRGESGSGKELVAKAIHDLSPRRKAPFLAINCAALSINLLESELFGHIRGAFSGAINDHAGLFQQASGGTLFLDEVAELPLELQAKLLRVIQERNYIPVGGNQTINVDVRIVTATHRSLRDEVKNGRFREDLMYRLRVVPIFIPSLRERREDINLLLWHFIQQHNSKKLRHIAKIDPQAMRILLDYHWPGNIRELQNVIEYAFVVGSGSTLELSELPPEFAEKRPSPETEKTNKLFSREGEIEAIKRALEQTNGKVNVAAEILDMSRATFWRKRKQYGI
jgi:transcriptional regulator with PAS, ATPase and Fis domain